MFTVTLIEGDDVVYSPKKVINFEVKENLPKNKDVQKYIRARLSEELSRNFSSLTEEIDNFSDDVKDKVDPLDSQF
jgi:hypothetical protein